MRQRDWMWSMALLLLVGSVPRLESGQAESQTTYSAAEVPEGLKPAVDRADKALQALQTTLLERLRRELDAGGPTAAVKVCRDEAQALTMRVAKEQGIALGRTSHKVRNPLNAPRPWARPLVEAAAGQRAAAVEARVIDLGDRIGILRPIATAEVCTHCHGAHDTVQRAIGRVLAEAYPADQAVGFAPGDLRGWMWAEVPKDTR